MYIGVLPACMYYEGVFLELELQIVENHHVGPLGEHLVLLTTELSFQPHIHALVRPFLPFGVLEV